MSANKQNWTATALLGFVRSKLLAAVVIYGITHDIMPLGNIMW